ncbi:MAG TPA: response regulator transcription factor [Actinomycetota bacterium]|nr:response regulator transcription factor [Actinomycetota bacterium]
MTNAGSVLVVSGDRLYGEAAAAALGAAGWGETSYAADALSALASIGRRLPSAVLVVGDELPRLAVEPFVQQVRRRWPDVIVVVVGSRRAAGAATLPPDSSIADVGRALALPSDDAGGGATEEEPATEGRNALANLTQRQRVVLRLLVEGLDMRAIGRELGVSEHTVRTHMQNLYARLGCHSRLELVRWATSQGLLSGESGSSSG